MTTKKIAIAIDGPAAAGKSTVAKKVARALNYIYIDTGAMYRAITYKAIEQNCAIDDEEALYQLLIQTEITLIQTDQEQRVILDDQDVTEEIRNEAVTQQVSTVAKHRLIRQEMVMRQRKYSEDSHVVMDGRDIGSYVLPNADIKLYLIASVDERAERRYQENAKKGHQVSLEQIKRDIAARDKFDMEREISPLIKAKDAIEIDTTSLTIDQVTENILDLVKQKGVN